MEQVKNEKKTSVYTNAGPRRRVRILVVEDYKNLQRVFSAMFCAMGFEVAHAENGLEALAAFLDSPFDLVLIDLEIPILNGSSLAHFIKEVSPNTPVIVLTGADEETVWKQSKSEAIYSVIFKPFEVIDFEKTVRGALELKNANPHSIPNPPEGGLL